MPVYLVALNVAVLSAAIALTLKLYDYIWRTRAYIAVFLCATGLKGAVTLLVAARKDYPDPIFRLAAVPGIAALILAPLAIGTVGARDRGSSGPADRSTSPVPRPKDPAFRCGIVRAAYVQPVRALPRTESDAGRFGQSQSSPSREGAHWPWKNNTAESKSETVVSSAEPTSSNAA